MSELPTPVSPMSFRGGREQSGSIREVSCISWPLGLNKTPTSLTKILMQLRYLQELQKQLEEHRRSPSANNSLDLQHQTGFQPQPSPTSQPQPRTLSQQLPVSSQLEPQPQIHIDPQLQAPTETQFRSLREPSASVASVTASIAAAQTNLSHSSYYSPPNLSHTNTNDQCSPTVNISPNISNKRTNEAAFGSGGLNSECRIDNTLASPALTIDGAQQPNIPPDSNRVPTYQSTNDNTLSVWPSALSIPSKIITNTHKNKRTWSEFHSTNGTEKLTYLFLVWLAPWSTWSFTVRLMLMLDEALHPGTPLLPPQLLESETYTMKWKTSSPSDAPNINGLPSLDHAIYLLNTFKFYIGQPYRLFDEAEFEKEIREFYANASQKATECRLWFTKFLLILAFGTAFLARPTASQDPPGAQFFTRAMALMPDNRALWKESLLAIQVLALVGLYLFSIDEMEPGHVYVSSTSYWCNPN